MARTNNRSESSALNLEVLEDRLALSTMVADFGSSGLYQWNGGWKQLTSSDALGLVSDDTDAVTAVFSSGTFRWAPGAGWSQLTGAVPEEFGVASNGTFFGDFGRSGLYRWAPGAGWKQLTGADAFSIEVADNGRLFADFSSGLWSYSAGAWSNLTSAHPRQMSSGADGTLFVSFASGVWRWNNSGWTNLTSAQAQFGVVGSSGDYFGDFGNSGIWHYSAGRWQQLTGANPFGVYS